MEQNDKPWWLQWDNINVYRAGFYLDQSNRNFERIEKLEKEIEKERIEQQNNMAQHVHYREKI